MEYAYPLTALATVLISILIFVFATKVGALRGKHDIKAPNMTGNEELECANRVHINTVEQVVIFLPVLWLFAVLVSDMYADIAGAVWIVGRVLYSQAYMKDPATRSTGFMITFAAFTVATVWCLVALFPMVF